MNPIRSSPSRWLWGLLAAVVAGLIWWHAAIVLPFVVSLILAYVLRPAVDALARRRIPRALAALACLLAVMLAGVVVFVLLVPIVSKLAPMLRAQLPDLLVGWWLQLAPPLAKAAGGNRLLGFLSAGAFATILAVVAGLALAGASAISHDLYARVIMKGQASEEKEIRVSKIATLGLGVVAVLLGMAFEKMNVAFMVALAFGVASCANFPVLLMSMYWKGLTTRGALVGGYTGLISSVLFVLFSKSVWVDVLGNKAALFPYTQPALFAMPLAFLAIYVFSKLDSSARAEQERHAFDDQYVRAQTGVGAATAAAH